MFNTSNLQTVNSAATLMIGTAFLAVASFGIAAPARAEAPAGFVKTVEASVNNTMRFPQGAETQKGTATVAVLINAEGAVQSATLVHSTGTAAFDREALRTAKAVRYPATGKNRTVAMVLAFNDTISRQAAAQGKVIVEAYRNDDRRLLASETTARPVG